MTEWVAVVGDEGDEPIEIPTESDGTMLLSSLTAQFPGVTGLKFRNVSTNTLRGVRCHENTLFPPDEVEGWGNHTYICTRPKHLELAAAKSKKEEAALKRKSENDPDGMSSKNQRVDDDDDDEMEDQSSTSDLIVLGLPWKATDQDLRDYFESFGELVMVQLKTKESGQSKGFAFIRFKDIEVQNKVLLTRHMLLDRWCDVKIPESQEMKNSKAAASCKIFVARLAESITAEDLKDHFETFGTVTDVYIPQPFRAFAFVTFSESRVAQSLFGKDHIVKGISVHIGSALPKPKENRGGAGGGAGAGGSRGERTAPPMENDRYGAQTRMVGGYDGGRGAGRYDGGGYGYGANQAYHSPWIGSAGSPSGGGGYGRGGQRGYY